MAEKKQLAISNKQSAKAEGMYPKGLYCSPEMLALLEKQMYMSPSTCELVMNPFGSYALSRRFRPQAYKPWNFIVSEVFKRLKKK